MDLPARWAEILCAEHNEQWKHAASLVEKWTLNVNWRDSIVQKSGGLVGSNEPWALAVLEAFESKMEPLRQAQHSRQGGVESIYSTLFEQAALYMSQGSYREAYVCLQAAKTGGPDLERCCLVLMSHLDIVQQYWSAVQIGTGKLLDQLHDWPMDLAQQMRTNCGLAAWMLGDYGDAVAVLVDSKPCIWLSEETTKALVGGAAVASLERPKLQLIDDELVRSFLNLDIPAFWLQLAKVEDIISNNYYLCNTVEHFRNAVRRRLVQTYLGVYSRCRASKFLSEFRYSLLDFIADVRTHQLPIQIDTVADAIWWSQTELHPGKELVSLYHRDTFALNWHSILS